MKKICIISVLSIIPAVFFAQTATPAGASGQTAENVVIVFNEDFAKGEELFTLNKPEEAIPLLENAVKAEGVNPAVYVYLGVAYYQVKEYQKSLDICVIGLSKPGSDRTVLAYNAGNSAYAMGNYARADACYAIALKNDDSYAPAYLNRANAKLKQDFLEDAREHYEAFLDRSPNDPQTPQIQRLLELLDEEIERRAREKPELILPEDLDIENAGMESPEPEFVEESEAPAVPPLPEKDVGEQVSEQKPEAFVEPKNVPFGEEQLSEPEQAAAFVEPKNVPFGEEKLTEAESRAREIPEEQLTSNDGAPTVIKTTADESEAVSLEEVAAAELVVPKATAVKDSETGEVVVLPVLPVPKLTPDVQEKALEAVESEEDELLPSDYWSD